MKKRTVELKNDKKVHTIRGKRVIADFDAAELYDVTLKTLRRAVAQNKDRFPDGYILTLSPDEYYSLTGTNFSELQNPKDKAQAFTKDGFIMLSNVLNSKVAVQFHIDIIRALHRAGYPSFALLGIHVTKEKDIPLN